MLTTAMLTAINDLRRNKGSVFFIATNQLFVGTPSLASRQVQFQQKLTGLGLSLEEKQAALQSDQDFLQDSLTKTFCKKCGLKMRCL